MVEPSSRLLNRAEAAQLLQQRGFPVAVKTLATMVSRGGGPAYRRFGQRALYRAEDLIAWAEARCSPPRRSSAEADDARG
jgi:carbamoylphosphate synthase large subunit